MASAKTIARRGFMVGSAAVAGGVAFGVWTVRRTHPNPLVQELGPDEASFNPWIKLTRDGITLIAPHADKGQGVFSTQAALIAEEMDLEWGDFDVSFGLPASAYFNSALAGNAAPFISRDTGALAGTARQAMNTAFKVLGAMGTGGSSSMPDSFLKLRAAGASARETLKQVAAARFDLSIDALRTERSRVILPDGREIPYTDLAADAARVKPVGKVALRRPDQWKLIGTDMLRLDIPGKSTGTLPFGIDVQIEGMKFAAVKTNPRQFGGMLSFDSSRAEAMRGVEKIVPVSNGVAVIADNTWRAFQALEAIDCEWGPAPYPAEQEEHWQAVSDSFARNRLDRQYLNIGDTEAMNAQGPKVEMEYRTGYAAHQPLEPLNATVQVTDEGASVWAGHQVPSLAVWQVSRVLGIKPAQVTFYNQFIGGSFGHRLEFEFLRLAAEVAGQMKGVPVKLTYSREEDFAHDFPRQIAMARATGVVEPGQVKSFDLQISSVSAVGSQASRLGVPLIVADPEIVSGAWSQPYALANFRVRAYRTPELAPTNSWRAVGAASAGFFADAAMDELLVGAGLDPLEGRLSMMTFAPYRKVLERVGELSNWGGPMQPGQGRGVAFVESYGVPVAMVVEVSNTPDGIRLDRVFTTLDAGPVLDPVNFENQVQGGVVWGLGHAMNAEITYSDGKAQQRNYHQHEAMRLYQCPEIIVESVDNGSQIRGVGEPPVPAAPPALSNAIFAATGQRIRELPMNRHIAFV
ncbi:MAG: xanthine dehydrogenase family protein molybdopterin-binding subunit [Alphaproteobacteria bacterium]